MLGTFVISITFIFIFAISLSDIRIKLRWNRLNGNDEIILAVIALYGWLKIERTVTKIDFINLKNGVQVDDRTITYHSIMKWMENFKKLLNHMVDPKIWFFQSIKRLKCEKMRWRTQIGLGDASWTAVSVGGIYAIKHTFLGIISNHIRFMKHAEMIVIPSYNKSVFTTQLDSMFRIRLAHAMYAAILLVLRISKTRGGIQLWRNILFKG